MGTYTGHYSISKYALHYPMSAYAARGKAISFMCRQHKNHHIWSTWPDVGRVDRCGQKTQQFTTLVGLTKQFEVYNGASFSTILIYSLCFNMSHRESVRCLDLHIWQFSCQLVYPCVLGKNVHWFLLSNFVFYIYNEYSQAMFESLGGG